MPASFALTIRSHVRASRDDVWEHATSIHGINAELGPWIRISHPAGQPRLIDEQTTSDRSAINVTILLGGIIPVDRMGLHIERWTPGSSLREHNASILHKRWIFDRSLQDTADGSCEIVDRLVYEPRLPGIGYFTLPLVARIIQSRHRTLRKLFGSDETAPPRTTRTCGAGAEEEAAAVAVGVGVVAVAVAVGVWAATRARRSS
jgi:hypothetical protein